MQIVIDIPDEIRKSIFDGEYCGIIDKRVFDAIKHGTPLPKGHGRLIDADWVKNTLDIYALNEYNGQFIRRNDIDSIPTIIEADKEAEE